MNVAVLGTLAKKQAASGWLSGYSYRKSFTYSRASGAVSDYPVKILVGESSGATGEDVDCNSHCLATFADLRFTKSDGTTELDYWIESVTGSTPNCLATVWVELDSVGTDATTFYMYYGKADASAASNGANTFIVFDNFERGSDGDAVGGDWTVGTGECKISTDHAYSGTRSCRILGNASPGYANMTIPVTASDRTYEIRARIWRESLAYLYLVHGNSAKALQWMVDTGSDIEYYDTAWHDTGSNAAGGTWNLHTNNDISFTDGTYDIYCNDAGIWGDASMTADGTKENKVLIQMTGAAGVDVYVDNFIVRNWRSVEPALGSWGSEETA